MLILRISPQDSFALADAAVAHIKDAAEARVGWPVPDRPLPPDIERTRYAPFPEAGLPCVVPRRPASCSRWDREAVSSSPPLLWR